MATARLPELETAPPRGTFTLFILFNSNIDFPGGAGGKTGVATCCFLGERAGGQSSE